MFSLAVIVGTSVACGIAGFLIVSSIFLVILKILSRRHAQRSHKLSNPVSVTPHTYQTSTGSKEGEQQQAFELVQKAGQTSINTDDSRNGYEMNRSRPAPPLPRERPQAPGETSGSSKVSRPSQPPDTYLQVVGEGAGVEEELYEDVEGLNLQASYLTAGEVNSDLNDNYSMAN